MAWGSFPVGAYTDDTQMSLATARGVLDWMRATGWSRRGFAGGRGGEPDWMP